MPLSGADSSQSDPLQAAEELPALRIAVVSPAHRTFRYRDDMDRSRSSV